MKECTCKHHIGDRIICDTQFTDKRWKSTCRSCCYIIRKLDREKHKDRVQREQREWRDRHKEHLSDYSRIYIRSERGRNIRFQWYERNRAQKRAYDKSRWRNDPVNRAKRLANGARYRAAKLKATPKWFEQERNAIEKLYFEAAVLTFETNQRHDVDHIVPLQGDTVSGLHTLCNLQIIPSKQNQSKKNKFD